MTLWVRSKLPVLCGTCGRVVEAKEPLEVIAINAVRRRLLRGTCCTETTIPENIEELPFHHDAAMKPLDLTRLHRLAQDWTQRSLGERE